MTSFLSQHPVASSTPSSIPTLTGASNFSGFLKAVKQHCSSNHGKSGQEINSSTIIALIHPHPGPAPHYNDPRLHPSLNTPILDIEKYPQVRLTREQAADEEFDTETLELTLEGKADFKFDCTTHSKKLELHINEIEKRQTHDTQLLNILLQHCSSTVKDSIKTNSKFANFEVHSTHDNYYHRGIEYLTILTDQYSKGNSITTVTEVSKFLDITQAPDREDSTDLFFVRVADQLQRIRPLIESTVHPGFVDINRLHSMVMFKGLDKTRHANLRALEIHMQTYPGSTSLDHPANLIECVLQYQQSDLATLSLDTETSVFASYTTLPPSNTKKGSSQPTSKPPARASGVKIPGNEKHCPFCLALTKKYFYHKEEDCQKKKLSNATSPTKANVATPSSITTQMAFDHLASEGYTFAQAPDDEK
jgi:hypothetical protein